MKVKQHGNTVFIMSTLNMYSSHDNMHFSWRKHLNLLT